jgi:hypothetical protein
MQDTKDTIKDPCVADASRRLGERLRAFETPSQPERPELPPALQPALYSVRAAMRAAGVPGWEPGSGVSSADAIRHLARERDEARRAAAEPPPIPGGCTWDGAQQVLRDACGNAVAYVDDDGFLVGARQAYVARYVLYQYDRAQAGGGQ